MSHCTNCQTPMNDQMIFCPVCGQKNLQGKKRFSKKSFFLTLSTFLLLVGGGYFAYTMYQSSQPLFQTSELTRTEADRDQALPQGFFESQRQRLPDEDMEQFITPDDPSPTSIYRFISLYAQRLPFIKNEEWTYYDSASEDNFDYADLFYGENNLTDEEREHFGERFQFSDDDPYSYVMLEDMTFDEMKSVNTNQFRIQTTENYLRIGTGDEDQRIHQSVAQYDVTLDDGKYIITSIKRSFKKEVKL